MSIKIMRKTAVFALALAMLLLLIPTAPAQARPAFSYCYSIRTVSPSNVAKTEILPDWSGIGRSTKQVHYKGSSARITVLDVNGMSGVTATYNGVTISCSGTTTITESVLIAPGRYWDVTIGTGYIYEIPNLGNEDSNMFLLRRGTSMVDNLSIYLS